MCNVVLVQIKKERKGSKKIRRKNKQTPTTMLKLKKIIFSSTYLHQKRNVKQKEYFQLKPTQTKLFCLLFFGTFPKDVSWYNMNGSIDKICLHHYLLFLEIGRYREDLINSMELLRGNIFWAVFPLAQTPQQNSFAIYRFQIYL